MVQSFSRHFHPVMTSTPETTSSTRASWLTQLSAWDICYVPAKIEHAPKKETSVGCKIDLTEGKETILGPFLEIGVLWYSGWE